MEEDETKPRNYLALDGGLSGLSGLFTLEEMLSRLQFDLKLKDEIAPWRHFDTIIGTGPGGLVVIFLGRLKMTASEAIESYIRLLPTLSVPPAKDDEEKRINTEAFKEIFHWVLKNAGYDSETPMLADDAPRTVVVTSNLVNPLTPHFIRSYRTRGSPAPPCTILQAACACIALQDRFLPVTIGEWHRKSTLADAITGYANPSKELMREAQSVFGEEAEVSTILSLGAGKIGVGASVESDHDELFEIMKRGGVVCEQVHEDMQTRLSDTSVYFRFNVEKEMGLSPETISTHTSAYLHEAAIGKKLDEAAKSIHIRPPGIRLKDINAITTVEIQLKPRPSLVQNFIGREEILESMRRTHLTHRLPDPSTPAITVLSGLGGSGKTQIALRFAKEFETIFVDTPVYFLNAVSEASLKADYVTLIRSQGTEYRTKFHQDALTWLATKLKNWLIILDNASDPNLSLFSYIPKCAFGNVIITTRNATHATLAGNSTHHVEGLSEADSVALVLSSSGYESTEANQALAIDIVRELGNLPLALAQAAGYIFVNKCLPRYLDIYRKSAVELLASFPSQRPDDYKSSVATTIQMALDRLPQKAQGVLRIFAHLDSTSIPYSVIAKAGERRFEHVTWTERSDLDQRTLGHAKALRAIFCKDEEWSDFAFNELITQCLHYSLLQLTTQAENSFYSMHIILRSYLKASSTLIHGHQPSQLAVRLLGSSITYSTNYEFITFNRLLLPQIRLIQLEDVVEAGDHFGFGCVFYEAGEGRLVLAHHEQCLDMWRTSLGDEHDNTLGSMVILALSYKAVGRSQNALELEKQVLSVRRKLLRPEHPNTLNAMHNLAISYDGVGRNQEAMKMNEQVLEIRRRVLGPEDPVLLTTMNNLAISYAEMGRAKDALKLREQVLAVQEKVLGSEHPDTLRSIHNLANSYGNMGRGMEAMELRGRVVELSTRVLGLAHPDTAEAMWNLGYSLRDRGLKMKLLELTRTSLPVYERVWGSPDKRSLWTRKELAELSLELEERAT